MKLVFVRHGVTLGNTEGRLIGHADYSLSEEERSQAERLRDRFKAEGFEPTHIYTSPLLRAAETASIVVSQWSQPIEPWNDLIEQNGGVLDGLTWDEIEAKYPNLYPAPEELIDWDSVVGAESNLLASDRAAKVINSVISHHSNDNDLAVEVEDDSPRFGKYVSNGGVMHFSEMHGRYMTAPYPGQHTRAIMGEMGYSDEQIDDYRERHIVDWEEANPIFVS